MDSDRPFVYDGLLASENQEPCVLQEYLAVPSKVFRQAQGNCPSCLRDLRYFTGALIVDCPTCQKVLHAIETCDPHILKYDDLTLSYGYAIYGNSLRLELYHNNQSLEEFELFAIKESTNFWDLARPRLVNPCLLSFDSLKSVEGWIDFCRKNHRTCAVKNAELPTRVIDVGAVDSQAPDTVTLMEPQRGLKGRYLCLSHRWDSSIPRTTLKTLEDKKKAISLASLPETYKNAIFVTRHLGIRYLWIDSLCIIQDDEDDWNRESVAMASIYSRSFLTLAISNPLAPHSAALLDHISSRGTPYAIYTRRLLRHLNSAYTDTQSFPLLKRGWIFQERLLSSRVLHIGPEELSWECTEMTECQCGTYHRPGSIKPHVASQASGLWGSEWKSLVQYYTTLQLTKRSDLLPALAGIATQMKKVRKRRYLWGIWEESLRSDIVWFLDLPSQQHAKPRSVGFYAPSWSWASTNGPIRFTASGSSDEPRRPFFGLTTSSSNDKHLYEPCESLKVLEVKASSGIGPLMGLRSEQSSSWIVLLGEVIESSIAVYYELKSDHKLSKAFLAPYSDDISIPNKRFTDECGIRKLVQGDGLKGVELFPDYSFWEADRHGYVRSGELVKLLRVGSGVFLILHLFDSSSHAVNVSSRRPSYQRIGCATWLEFGLGIKTKPERVKIV